MSTLIHRRVEQARRGENPTVIRRMRSGWLVLGDVQFLPGYCVLLSDPVVDSLNDLPREQRLVFLDDLALAGDAVLSVTGAARINYEILCNQEPALHAHVFPRYSHESDELRTRPVWFYDWAGAEPFNLARDADLMRRIGEAVDRLTVG